jgi:hypothetical protein
MARPRREADYTALYVRIPSAEAEKLHRAADVLVANFHGPAGERAEDGDGHGGKYMVMW